MKQERSKWQRTQVAPAICQQGSEALTPEAPEVLDASNTRGMSLEVNPLSAELSDETAGSPATSQPVRDSEQRSQGSYAWIPDPWKLRGMKLRVRSSKRNTPLVSFPSRFPEDTCVQKEGRQKSEAESRCCLRFPGQSRTPEGRVLCVWAITTVASLWMLDPRSQAGSVSATTRGPGESCSGGWRLSFPCNNSAGK